MSDNKAPRELFIGYPDGETPEVVFDVTDENSKGAVKFIEKSAYDKLQSRLEKCEGLLKEIYVKDYYETGKSMELKIQKYFAEGEKEGE